MQVAGYNKIINTFDTKSTPTCNLYDDLKMKV